jgi:hypothetical protein
MLSRDAFSLITYAKLSSNFVWDTNKKRAPCMIVFAGFIAISCAIYKQNTGLVVAGPDELFGLSPEL